VTSPLPTARGALAAVLALASLTAMAGASASTPPVMVHPFHTVLSVAASSTPIAIVDAYDNPTIEADLAKFSSTFGLKSCTTANGCFSKIFAAGATKPKYDPLWAVEIALDVEWAHAISPGARIVLVEATTAAPNDMERAVAAAVATGARQISNSWGTDGECYPFCHAYDPIFATPGTTFLVSSGDHKVQSWPSTNPQVVSVGGTTINSSGGSLTTEVAWSDGGGGPSTQQPPPPAQLTWYAGGRRGTPDVAAVAGTGYAIYTAAVGGWIPVGGTSASCPLWAALFAQANAGKQIGLPGGPTPVYAIADQDYAKNFKDITSGSNGNRAVAKYDLATGLGSPNANTVAALRALTPK